MIVDRRRLVAGAALAVAMPALARTRLPRVLLTTGMGRIVIELDTVRAPVTAGNFLRYVDRGLFADGHFYRVVRPDNDHNPATISVVQGGLSPREDLMPPIAHETTAVTGIRNTDGVLSMARDAPGSATSEFSISVGDNPALDFGGARNPDGQGFAAFGRVVSGMTLVRRIDRLPADGPSDSPYTEGQMLARPIAFAIRRIRA